MDIRYCFYRPEPHGVTVYWKILLDRDYVLRMRDPYLPFAGMVYKEDGNKSHSKGLILPDLSVYFGLRLVSLQLGP
jgi:hypothetical protein